MTWQLKRRPTGVTTTDGQTVLLVQDRDGAKGIPQLEVVGRDVLKLLNAAQTNQIAWKQRTGGLCSDCGRYEIIGRGRTISGKASGGYELHIDGQFVEVYKRIAFAQKHAQEHADQGGD